MSKLYVIRHCAARGQAPEAPLTAQGTQQAEWLTEFFSTQNVDHIISSPFERAIQSITPFSQVTGIPIVKDERLKERVLSNENLEDWLEKLKVTFEDMELRYNGGESSKDAMNRIIGLFAEIIKSDMKTSIIVTHGNLLSLALKYYDSSFGFEDWKKLSNPDIYLLQFDGDQVIIKHLLGDLELKY
ncbi:histidine phosphatase family protein [Sporosarcina aquimarina]|uniref:histidine phosphatase family protein n=1 Tax=Sporosarcina aquimarina TaxID=114975 RepID=UPI00204127B4|nr:histidine phosphatase family protein [Sporosarcina aquimarina]MCM3758213.1 histidine phosphatase family protein [Sporosarcina aquimarina]